jgi:hypothetical protein
MDSIQLTDNDDEELARIFKEIMDHSESNKAAPVSDLSMMPDPMGNG